MKLRATLLVAILCSLFTGTAWADVVTFDATTDITANAQSYVTTELTINANDGSTWKANGYGATASANIVIGKGGANYLETPQVNGTITSVAVTWSGNANYYLALQTTSGTELEAKSNVAAGTTATFTVSGSYSQLRLVGRRSSGSSNAAATITRVVVTYTPSGGSSAAATTTTIDASYITNTDVYTSTAAGSLSASVTLTSGGTAVPSATVTWSGDNDAVATINSSTGAVTLVAAGTVTFTASYNGESGTYQASSDTYEMTVTSSAPYVQPTEFDINLNNSLFGTSYSGSASGITDSNPESGTLNNVTVTYAGSGNHYINNSQIRFYPNNKLTFEAPSGYEIKSIVFTSAGTWAATISANKGTYTSDTKTWAGSATSVIFTGSGSSRCDMSKAAITIGLKSSDPSISANDVDITYDATEGSIAYTLENATGNVTATVTEGNWLTLGTITSSAVPFTCSANPNNTSRTATVTLSFSGADDKVVTVTQAAAPVVYTTIPALFDAATTAGSTATNVNVTFGNWVVSGVSGSNAFVTDNSGNGFIIYTSNHGFAVNDKLSGTVLETPLKLYNGSAEFTNLTSSTTGLTVSNDGEVTVITNKTIADLGGVNTGAVITLSNLTYDGTNLSDGTNSIRPYNTLYSSMSFESGHKYNVTGVYQQFGNSTKDILPRSSADIVEVFTPAISVSPASLSGFTYEVDNGPSTTKTVSVSGSNLTADITLSLGNNSDFEMSTTEGSGYTNSLTLTQSAGAVAATTVYVRLKSGLAIGDSYSGTITLTSTDATDATVTLSGSVTEPVVDYATLPFSYSGNGSETSKVSGLTPTSLTNYNSAPLIKFDAASDALVLKLNEAPGVLSFDIKGMGNGTWSGTFDVLTSDDGVDYSTTLQQYTSLSTSAASREVFTLASSVRYIKWVFTLKTSGFNVALGNIVVEKPNVTLNASGYATYTSNSAIDYSQASGYTAWAITSISGTAITFSKVTGAVPAGTGVLLMGSAGQTVAPVATTSGTAPETNLLEGITIATAVNTDDYYGLSGSQFKKVNAGTVKAGKALLPASAVTGSNVKAFTFVFEDTTTGITETREVSREEVESIFNLGGQRLSKMQRGVNIVNGKKVLVR